MRIVSRVEAGLAAPRKAISPARASRGELFLHHSVTTTSSDPLADWRTVQKAAFGRGFADISYTFGVHANGTILEGRSPFVEGAHTEGHNRSGHAIVLIGNYHAAQKTPPPLKPTDAQVEAVRWLRCHMTGIQLLTPDHTFRPHQAVKQTACPGSSAVARWDDFARPTSREVRPMFDPPIALRPIVAALACRIGGAWLLGDDGSVYAFGGAPYHGGCNGKGYFAGRTPAMLEPADRDDGTPGYRVVATSGEKYGPVF